MAFILGEFLRSQPSVPKFTPVDVNAQTAQTLDQSQKYLPQATALATDLSTANESLWQKIMGQQIPGYANIQTQSSNYIQSLLGGEIPQDVQDSIQRSGAVKSFYGGYSGTGMGRNLVARDLGLTSLNLQQQGFDAATRWTGMAQQSLASRFVSPGDILARSVPDTMQRTQVAVQQQESKFQRDYLKSVMDAQYSTGSRLAATEDSFMKML